MSDRVIYVSNTEEFNAAFEKLSSGGTVSVTGEISLEHTRLPRHYGKITVTGGTLSFDRSVTLTLGGETVFENITINVKSSGVIAADFHPLTFGNGVNVVCDFSEETNGLYLVGGENNVKSEKDVYEKKIADINAKTQKIQEQDRTLELRLRQLDTEQDALQTEMEAVKKVIEKNIESTFKTFE